MVVRCAVSKDCQVCVNDFFPLLSKNFCFLVVTTVIEIIATIESFVFPTINRLRKVVKIIKKNLFKVVIKSYFLMN